MSDTYHQLIKAMHEALGDTHESYDSQLMNEVANVYLECIDKEGFVFNFNDAWRWAGYSTKGSAKRVLLRELRENIDYKISRNIDSINNMRRQDSKGEKGKNGGDRKSEKILLTQEGLRKFLICNNKKSQATLEILEKIWAQADRFVLSSGSEKRKREQMVDDFIKKRRLEEKQKSKHDQVSDTLAFSLPGAQRETKCEIGRVDIETNEWVIEVKNARKALHALGQVQGYAYATGKKPWIHLFFETNDDRASFNLDFIEDLTEKYGVKLTFD